jgi:hypothetical protein
MSQKPADLDQWIDAMAPLLRLPVAEEHRAGVKANLKTAAKMAALVEKAEPAKSPEPAPVYRP